MLNGYIRRMPTIESMGSGEIATSFVGSTRLGGSVYTSQPTAHAQHPAFVHQQHGSRHGEQRAAQPPEQLVRARRAAHRGACPRTILTARLSTASSLGGPSLRCVGCLARRVTSSSPTAYPVVRRSTPSRAAGAAGRLCRIIPRRWAALAILTLRRRYPPQALLNNANDVWGISAPFRGAQHCYVCAYISSLPFAVHASFTSHCLYSMSTCTLDYTSPSDSPHLPHYLHHLAITYTDRGLVSD